ncbi:hypothetical protein MPER_07186 [Moniliophthora perniciosa FA553]|nr:hypothetical protein MPER_07186 [Moniliophthora perniciosa FA553]
MASPRLASGIIRRIIYEISKPSTEDFNSQALKQALTMLINCAMNASQFNMACIQRRSIYWVCLTMRRISGRKSRFFEADFYYIADCLKFCAMYLERTFEDFGHTAVIQALQARLISSLLRSADFILVDQRNRNQGSPSSLGAIYQSILHSIAGYAMYYSVTTVLVKSLRHIDEHHDIDSVNKSGALNPDFKMFRRAGRR